MANADVGFTKDCQARWRGDITATTKLLPSPKQPRCIPNILAISILFSTWFSCHYTTYITHEPLPSPLMKSVSILLSIIIGFISIFIYRERILDTVTTVYGNFSNNTASTTTSDSPEAIGVPAANMSIPRAIRKVFLAVEQAEGAGARVRRSIGTPQLRNFSPFLMLDHFSVKHGAGFPDHPHRGQEVSIYSSPPPRSGSRGKLPLVAL